MSIIGNIYGFLGYYNHSRSKLEKAEELYKKSMAKGCDIPNYKLAYGVLLLKKGEFEKARDLFSGVLISAPSKGNIKIIAKINLSIAYWKLGEVDTAIEMLEEVYAKFRNGRLYETMGYILLENGDLDKALEFNLEALDYDDENPIILDNLGQTYYRLGQKEKAKEYFEKAEELRDNQVDILYHLGCVYMEEGKKELAKEKLKKALECDITPLNSVSRSEIETKLRELD